MNQFVTATKPSKSGNKTIRTVRLLHIYASMLMLLVMLFFTVTGITLNHRDWFSDTDPAQVVELNLPEAFSDAEKWNQAPIDQANLMRHWLRDEQGVFGNQVNFEWEAEEQLMVIDIKRPGGYSLVEVDLDAGAVLLEKQSFGTVALLNDLHMGRYSGDFWRLFIDLAAVIMLVFTLTGFWLVIPQKKRRNKLFTSSVLGLLLAAGFYLTVMML